MFLHEDRGLFREIVETASAHFNIPISIMEKDYYVTMILRELSRQESTCVFKGGTSLSKCYHVIERFSEDIDVAFCHTLTQGQKKNLKNKTVAGISKKLGMPISDWEKARSRRDYNCYTFAYEPLEGVVPKSLMQGVKLEISLGSVAFPTERLPVDSYISQFLEKENKEIIEEFGLGSFIMTLQSLERTLIDKVFAVCDYYMSGKIKRKSRHIYDIYMLLPKVKKNSALKRLVHEVRVLRSEMRTCPSAKKGVDVQEILKKIISEKVFARDYAEITMHILIYSLSYEEVIKALMEIIESNLFIDEEFI